MSEKRALWLILALALALRLIFALAQDPLAPYQDRGGDTSWYLGTAYAIVTNTPPQGTASDGAHLTPPPFYFLMIGIPQAILSPAAAIIAVQILQAILSTATCYFAYRLARLLTGRGRAGLIAATALALSPVFIIEASHVLTETVYIFFVTGGLWLYVESLECRGEFVTHADSLSNGDVGARHVSPLPTPRYLLALLLGAAVLFGLATLTRAVLLAFPLALAVYLLMMRVGWRRAALFLLVYALVVSTWTIYSLARWNRFVIAGDGLTAFLYLGATGWSGPQQVDQNLAQQSPTGDYMQAAQNVIGGDPLGWVKRRVTELANAYLQPHGTTFYPGASLKDLTLDWLREDRTLPGLMAVMRGESFFPKLAIYLLHYTALIVGLIGMWLYRRRWRVALPLIGFIAYTTLAHLLLLALPRYLFPTEVFWWVFAAAALDSALKLRRSESAPLVHANS